MKNEIKFKVRDKVIAYDAEAEIHGMIGEKAGIIEEIDNGSKFPYLVKIRNDFPSKGNKFYSNWFAQEDLRKI